MAFSIQPASIAVNATNKVLAVGRGTAWTSGTTFSATGGTGASATVVSVNVAAQTALVTLVAGSVKGALTMANSTDAGTTTVNVVNAPKPNRKWFNGLGKR